MRNLEERTGRTCESVLEEYHDLFIFNFLGENYAFSTRGEPDKDKPVFLRCVDDLSFPAQETRIPAPYDHDSGMDTAYESWDSKSLGFIVGNHEIDFININIHITERSGYSYPGQFDDSVPSYVKSKKNVFLRKEREHLFMSFPGMKTNDACGMGRRVEKKFKDN